MSEPALVTVLIPARNEEPDIERCIRSVLVQDHPHDRMEIVLVDGGSTDRTAAVASRALSSGDIDWKIVDNPAGTTPSNLNAGLAAATGEILCRVDARSIIPPHYVRLCDETLATRAEVSVTGGAQVAMQHDGSAQSAGIARALNNKYTMGGSRYRSGAQSGATDTVYLGAFRCEELREAGGWDERMLTNQDFDLNRRMGRRGVVWFDNRLEVGYVPRRTIRQLWRQYHRFGRWKVRYWRITGESPLVRQLAPIAALPVAVALAAGTARRKGPRTLALAAPVVGAAVLLATDAAGNDSPAPMPARIVGAAASVTVVIAWVTGVYRELITPADNGPMSEHR